MNRLIWATNYDFAWWKRECRVQFTEGLRYLFALFYVAVFCFIFINFNGLYVRLCVGRNIFLSARFRDVITQEDFPLCVREMESFFPSLDLSRLKERIWLSDSDAEAQVAGPGTHPTPYGCRSATEHSIPINRIVIELLGPGFGMVSASA